MADTTIMASQSDASSMPDEIGSELPTNLSSAIQLLPLDHQRLISKLYLELKQSHLFKGFDSSMSPSIRRQFGQQLSDLDKSYPDGGLEGYLSNARKLLDDSRQGANPYNGWNPTLPEGETCELGSKSWKKAEEIGIKELGSCGFVLVAGGLGERLGYKGIKVRHVVPNQTIIATYD